MKKVFLRIIQALLSFRVFRKLVKIFFWEYNKRDQKIVCKKISPGKKILRGPFKGVQYASFNSAGSSLLAKILGSYEDELHETIYSVLHNNYSEIIDVGCAEGYYAVGFAGKSKAKKIYAFDTDKRAIELCMQNAAVNEVNSKIIPGDFCSDQTLADFKFTGHGFIFSDCEGYEKTLFNNKNSHNLGTCDMIIEMHHLVHPDIKEYLQNLFSKSHHIHIIPSRLKFVDDYPELASIGKEYYRDSIISERDTRQEWMFLKAKNSI